MQVVELPKGWLKPTMDWAEMHVKCSDVLGTLTTRELRKLHTYARSLIKARIAKETRD